VQSRQAIDETETKTTGRADKGADNKSPPPGLTQHAQTWWHDPNPAAQQGCR